MPRRKSLKKKKDFSLLKTTYVCLIHCTLLNFSWNRFVGKGFKPNEPQTKHLYTSPGQMQQNLLNAVFNTATVAVKNINLALKKGKK